MRPLQAPPVVFLGGRFLATDEPPTVSLFDRGYLLGDSVFASLRVWQGYPFAISRHLARFCASALAVGIEVPDARALEAIAIEACARFRGDHGVLRVTVSRGEGGPGLAIGPAPSLEPTLSVVVREILAPPFAPPTAVRIASLRAPPAACLDPSLKVGSYGARVQMRREAETFGNREAIVLGIRDEVVSGVASNVFVLKKGVMRTPTLASGARAGVTRELCMDLLATLAIPVLEARLERADLRGAEALFFTSSVLPMLTAESFEDVALDTSASEIVALRGAFERTVAESRAAPAHPPTVAR